ncbi:GNAT family N-acetyltransferase [Streptomyces sp. WELS2]|uniref:GNAT family N-acetyltransferase n=1 Tax=Streptomyces sp. WELS2 TaxID=2749435 RepID=UPI0015F0C126|nr:GNAT family N-acetyltransferase [Streptomyces sp. WELS2]
MSDAPDLPGTPGLPEGYEFSADPARVDVGRVHGWLSSDTYWAPGRPREKHERAMASSLNFGVYATQSGEQVAYARVVTDRALFAWLADVYVDPSVRGKGVGTAFVARIRDHLAPFGLSRLLLATEDAHGVYARLGFRPLEHPEQYMAHTFD